MIFRKKQVNIITKEKAETELRPDYKIEFRPPTDEREKHLLYIKTFGILNMIEGLNKIALLDIPERATALVMMNSEFDFWDFLKQHSYINGERAYFKGDLDDPDFFYGIYWGYVMWLHSHKVIESFNKIFKPVKPKVLWNLLDIMKDQRKRKVHKSQAFADAFVELIKKDNENLED